jgi:UDP-glucose:(heptosyl)LPS alpha-1,3-glucosyltransferase
VDKVLTLIRQFPVGPGGAERYVDLLVRGLVARGFRINLLCADCPPQVFDAAQVDVVRLDVAHWGKFRWFRPWFFAMQVQSWLKRYPQTLVFSLERQWRQDILRAGDGVHAEWLARRAKRQGWWARSFRRLAIYHRLTCWSERRAYDPERTLRVMANSEFVKQQIVKRFDFPERRIEVIHNGVNVEDWENKPDGWLRECIGAEPEALVAVFSGTGWERKGLRIASEAMEAWRKKTGRPAYLVVVGRGPRWKFPEPGLFFVGHTTRKEMARHYRGADLLFLPTHYDPFANVTLEALACGLPVVTSDANGGAEVVRNGETGRVVADQAPMEAWVEALEEWSDPAKRESARDACRRTAEENSMPHHIDRVLALCEAVFAFKTHQPTPPAASSCATPSP